MPAEMTAAEAETEIERFANEFDSKTNPINYSSKTIKAMRYASSLFRKLTAGELREVVHGHWNKSWKHMDGCVSWYCSVCYGVTNAYIPTPICPWCGALMDADRYQFKPEKEAT